jgi:hypothetical protein
MFSLNRREVYPEKALLRLGHYKKAAPQANNATAAAHLVNLALDTVVARMQRQRDPRMRALKSVSSLESLHVGDISKYKWGGRQPVRRRRGDVHGDMTLLVMQFNSAGMLPLMFVMWAALHRCCFEWFRVIRSRGVTRRVVEGPYLMKSKPAMQRSTCLKVFFCLVSAWKCFSLQLCENR